MSRRICDHLRSNVVAYTALLLALTGTAVALPGHNKVSSDDIVNGAVKGADISNLNGVGSLDVRDDTEPGGGLTAEDLRTGSVGVSEIGDAAVESSELASNSVHAGHIVPGAVQSPAIATGAVQSPEIAADAVAGGQLLDFFTRPGTPVNVNDPTGSDGDWQQVEATASCGGAGERLVGFSAEWTSGGDENATQEITYDFSTGVVTARGITDNGTQETFRAVAVCMVNFVGP
jgi:hypothetical protein